MEGWVDLGYLEMHRPRVEPAIFWSLVRRPYHYTTMPILVVVVVVLSSISRCSTIVVLSNDRELTLSLRLYAYACRCIWVTTATRSGWERIACSQSEASFGRSRGQPRSVTWWTFVRCRVTVGRRSRVRPSLHFSVERNALWRVR